MGAKGWRNAVGSDRPHLEEFDDLNLYAYAGNDPVDKTDPSGLYICSGSRDNCDAVEAGLHRARQAFDRMKPGDTKDKLGKVLSLFGHAGDKNGTNVSFSDKTDVASAKMEKDGSVSVSINSDYSKFGTGYESPQDVRASSLVHEGQHGVDERALGRNPGNRAEVKATERNAYNLESRFQQTMGTKSFHGLWDPGWPAGEAESKRASAVEEYAEYSTQAWCVAGGSCQ
jgi:hypothetical protein